jgi:hemoglobin
MYSIIGEDGFTRLVAAFYGRIPSDDVLGPMYSKDDLAGAEQRLRDFLIGRFGGPQRYIEQRGHPRLRARHAHFPIDSKARRRWLDLMAAALLETALPPAVEAELRSFFESAATMMVNRPD